MNSSQTKIKKYQKYIVVNGLRRQDGIMVMKEDVVVFDQEVPHEVMKEHFTGRFFGVPVVSSGYFQLTEDGQCTCIPERGKILPVERKTQDQALLLDLLINV